MEFAALKCIIACLNSLQVPEQAHRCIKRLKSYIDPLSGRSIPGALENEDLTRSMFQA